MRQAEIRYNAIHAGFLYELETGEYEFIYADDYVQKYPHLFITFNMPVRKIPYKSNRLFPFFDGIIPEGWLLQIASDGWKINLNDRMGLLLACCQNAIGAVSVHPFNRKDNE